MTAGGKRKGAGRPPLHAEDRPQAVTVRIHPQLVRRFADCAQLQAQSFKPAEQIARAQRPCLSLFSLIFHKVRAVAQLSR